MARETRGDFYPVPIVDQNTRPGAITRLIVFIVVLTGAAIVFGLFRERLGDPFLLGMLGVLAMIGVGYLFATAIGFVQIAPRSTTDELSKAFVDSMSQGLVVTDTKGRVVYANRAYADMTGASSSADMKTVEGLLSDVPEARSTIYRLASGLRDGQAGDGEFRLAQSIRPGAEPGARWYRVESARLQRARPAPAAACLAACRHLEGAGRAGAVLPRPAKGDRSSRPCAGRLLLRRPGRPRHLHQRHACRVAGHRPGQLHARRHDAAGDRRRRRHGAGPLGQGRSRHDPQRGHRSRSGDGDRRGAAGALHAPRFGQPRGAERPDPHHRAQPHPGRGCLGRSARLGGPLHALLQLDADGDRRASTRRAASCAPTRRSCRCFRRSSTATPSTAACGSTR